MKRHQRAEREAVACAAGRVAQREVGDAAGRHAEEVRLAQVRRMSHMPHANGLSLTMPACGPSVLCISVSRDSRLCGSSTVSGST